jgi:hypothetical protein
MGARGRWESERRHVCSIAVRKSQNKRDRRLAPTGADRFFLTYVWQRGNKYFVEKVNWSKKFTGKNQTMEPLRPLLLGIDKIVINIMKL